jgi:hypothetical protein
MVHLQGFHERYEKDGLFVFAISMEPKTGKAQESNRELGITYTVFDGYGSALGERLAYG